LCLSGKKDALSLTKMKKIIFTEKAPAPIGPYNQAVLVGNTLYTSGQIAINPATNELVLDNIEDETKLVMENLKAVLEAAEMTFENVVKVSIFISDMGNFANINAVYGSYFNEATAPARETVQVACLPKNVNVEISAVAIK
jgi:2-iminobutanoate/2-iminopropanoate deaminase